MLLARRAGEILLVVLRTCLDAATPARATGSVRIIAGEWRGRRIPIVAETAVRPTPDRVRETVFNWLQTKI